MQTDTRPTPEPLHLRKERQAAEGQAAWTHYRAEQDAVNKNMERLRAARIAREAALVPAAPDTKARKAKSAKVKSAKTKTKSAKPGEDSRAQNQADRP
jgi:hypothetical protein